MYQMQCESKLINLSHNCTRLKKRKEKKKGRKKLSQTNKQKKSTSSVESVM